MLLSFKRALCLNHCLFKQSITLGCLFSLPTYLSLLPPSLPDSSKTKTENTQNKSKQQSSDLMKFSLSKPVFVEPDARGSGVPLIKVLTCFDMHEWVFSLCLSVLCILSFFFVFFFRALLTLIKTNHHLLQRESTHSGLDHKLHKYFVIVGNMKYLLQIYEKNV